MQIAKLTSKGQLTIPKEVRDSLELRTGDHVVFIEKDGGYFFANSRSVEIKTVNISSISASLAAEGLETTSDMLDYAARRMKGGQSYDGRLRELAERYKNV
jgi:AbrB family looped-hinge helix DNA binding protein